MRAISVTGLLPALGNLSKTIHLQALRKATSTMISLAWGGRTRPNLCFGFDCRE